MSAANRQKLTPPQVAERFGISPDKVVAWITSGELRAINGARSQGGRPRYLIDLADLEAFESARAVVPNVQPRRRKRQSAKAKFYAHQ